MSKQHQNLYALLDKYTHSFPSSSAKPERHEETVVLLSGSTGIFGSSILAALVSSPAIARAYAVSRPSLDGVGVRERHARAFRREGFAETLLDDDKVRLLDGDLTMERFRMDSGMFEELQSSVTHIIHNGWQVNLNRPISEFEPNIRSVRNLVDFALRSPARGDRPAKLIFISSLGVFQNVDLSDPDRICPEEHIKTPEICAGLGYAEAKWVSEQVLAVAAQRTTLRPTVVRLGQIVGGPGGYWSEREWFPSLIKSSLFLGMLPDVPGALRWNTSHVAARALLDMLDSDERYLHLVHPKPVSWTVLITIFARKFRLPVVHIDEWTDALERSHALALVRARALQSDSAPSRELMRTEFQRNPASRILAYFRQARESARGKPLEPDQQTSWTLSVHTEKAVAASPTLRDINLPQIGEADVDCWVAKWRQIGFLPEANDESTLKRKSSK